MTVSSATPRTPDPKPKAAAARDQILTHAARMMRARGYADMSLRELAAEVGMKAGSLYYHFPSKEALATDVMRLGVEIVSDAVQAGLEDAPDLPPRARMTRAMQIHLETLLSASDFSSAHIRCYPFVPVTVQSELKSVRKKYDKIWSALIEQHLGPKATPTDIRYLRYAIIGALNWSLEWFDPAHDDAALYVTSVADRLLRETP
ncbi:TetR/AcrR family transcriptional regulator [Rhodobacteraceae bacterium M382]|nr:TetR/AcrR family transcriptional regulator [Rhodobacteraceae bacterium M382]